MHEEINKLSLLQLSVVSAWYSAVAFKLKAYKNNNYGHKTSVITDHSDTTLFKIQLIELNIYIAATPLAGRIRFIIHVFAVEQSILKLERWSKEKLVMKNL